MKSNTRGIDNNAIGQRIRSERERLKLTREEFAEKINLSPLYIGQLERGERQMSLDTLVKISNYLHISTDYIIFGNDIGEKMKRDRIITLLDKCSRAQLLFIEEMIKLIITHIDN